MWGKMDKKQVLDVLKESLGMEEKGHKFYKEGSEKIRNSLGKRMLQRLAEEVKIEKAQIADFDDIFTRMKEQLKDASEEMTDVGVDDEEIIDMALELESHAKFFYEDAAKKASDNKVRKFYEMLAQEENSHYELLRNTHNYLENPSLFYGMGYH
jgi:rubrerythrin